MVIDSQMVGMLSGAEFDNEVAEIRASVVNEQHQEGIRLWSMNCLAKDCTLVEISRSNGKNALHLAARQGHVDILKALCLTKIHNLARRTDKKGQTALHMAVKGVNCEVVKCEREAEKDTGEVLEFDVGLSAVDEELGVVRAQIDGLRVEINGQVEVFVDEGILSLAFQIRRHGFFRRHSTTDGEAEKEHRTEQSRTIAKRSTCKRRGLT
nr:ankyrin repeat-containing protein ITN1 [Ipomoea batatas]